MHVDWDTALADVLDGFTGVVSVSRGEDVEFEHADGLADRAHGTPMTIGTRFGVASVTKGFTAAAVLALIADGTLRTDTTARSLLDTDLPLVADDVTVAQLLTHTSGIGDYVDEELDEFPLPKVPVQDLDTVEDYLPALDGFPAKFAPGTRFAYCNGGYAVLAILAQRASGVAFPELLRRKVFEPAAMTSTGFPRSDEPAPGTATGYLDDGRTNVFWLPVRGSGDGGAVSTADDLRRFWAALFAGAIVPAEWAARMTSPTTTDTGEKYAYGMGCWIYPDGQPFLEGCDYGVSARSAYDRATRTVATVIGTTTDGAFPVAVRLRELLFDRPGGAG